MVNIMKNKKDKKYSFKGIFYRVLLTLILVLLGTLIIKKNSSIKGYIFNNIYSNNISFSKIKNLYNQKIGSIIPFENIVKNKEVFNEKIRYNNISKYDNGFKLTLDNNYSIPIISDGIVIFIGEKDNLNKTVIIEDENGINHTYGNLDNINVKLYDYVSKNDLLGTAKDNTLYLIFSKNGEYFDYKKFLK